MKKISSYVAPSITLLIIVASTTFGLSAAHAEPIDVRHLQTCLKAEGSSLDVLVLMDSSASLRNARSDDGYIRANKEGSDPDRKRGKILKSSLKILRSLADQSERQFNISLRNFGENSDPKELNNLKQHWIDWTPQPSDSTLNRFVEQALYDDSKETEWTNGLITAKNQFKDRIGQAQLDGKKSCAIMFWITDGAPTDKTEPICAVDSNASINWFRENNILILGGLLKPKGAEGAKAENFKPMITGESCGENREGWTKGEVIEANDISDLAWGFVGLIASIKNLVNLNENNSTFYVDPSTSHMEIFIRGNNQQNWEIKQADGTIYCSANSPNPTRCKAVLDPEIGITTISIFPENPVAAAGAWTLSPAFEEGEFKVYGGLNTIDGPKNTQPKLIITRNSPEVEEGKEANFQVKIVNPDGTDFSADGYKSITICAKVESLRTPVCKSGNVSATLSVKPALTDKSVEFEATLVSAKSDSREPYRIPASVSINVIKNGKFPSLICKNSKNFCQLKRLANKNDRATTTLQVLAPENGSSDGRLSLVGYTVLSDKVEGRNFIFKLNKPDSGAIEWNSQGTVFAPGDTLSLTVSTDHAGDGEVQGVIKYKVNAGGEEIIRELQFKLEVGQDSNPFIHFLLLLVAYLLTIGLPYLFLLWSARRAAVLNVPDGEFSYLVLPFEITKEGKLVGLGDKPAGATFAPDYKKLEKRSIEANTRSVTIDKAEIAAIPPKWNPFAQAKTRALIPGNYLLTTCGDQSLAFENAPFISSLLDEVIIYFPEEGNITAENITTEELTVDDTGLGYLNSEYETQLSNTITAPTTPVLGNVIFIVSPYGNREKSLTEIVSKLNTAVANIPFLEGITELRDIAVKKAVVENEAKKALETIEKAKQSDKRKAKNKVEEAKNDLNEWSTGSSSEDDWGGSSNSKSQS